MSFQSRPDGDGPQTSSDIPQDIHDTERNGGPHPLPKSQIAILWFLQLCEPIANTVIYPFVAELVRNLNVAHGDDRRVGYYVGFIESIFFMTECLCVLQWGRLSDIIGRRPVILFGLCGVTLSISCFGFSRTFATVVLSRSISGLTNGNIGVIKSTIGELADDTNVAQAFRYMPLCWPIGETIGPLIGGMLANPAKRFPNVFGGSPFWETYPYLLPCLTAALFPLSGFIVSALFLRETVPHPSRPNILKRIRAWRKNRLGNSIGESRPLLQSPPSRSSSRSSSSRRSLRSILTPRVLIVVLSYCLFALANIAYSVLQPLFLSTPIQHGGLGMTPHQIGIVMGIQGTLATASVLGLSGALQRRFGNKNLFSVAIASFFVLLGLYPVMNGVALREGEVGWAVFVPLGIQISLFGVVNVGYGCIFILVNNASPSRKCLGSTNGLAQTAASFMRAVGPAGTTALFAVSVEKELYVFGVALVYVVLVGVVGVGVVVSRWVDDGPMGCDDDDEGQGHD